MRLEGSPNGKRTAKRLRKVVTSPEMALCLAIQVDGAAQSRPDRPMRDTMRGVRLVSRGLLVVRHPAAELLTRLDDVVGQIVSIALERRGWFES